MEILQRNLQQLFYVVFSGIHDTEQNEETIKKFCQDLTFDFDDTTDPTQHNKITFKVEMVSLSILKETKRELFDWVWAEITDALILGRASAYGVTW